MTPAVFKPSPEQVQAIINWWKPVLGLSDWRITFEIREDLEPRAECDRDNNYPSACLRFRAEYQNGTFPPSIEDFEELVVHELLHVLEVPMKTVVWDARQELPKPLRRMYWGSYQRQNELFVETLARSLVAAKRSNSSPIAIGDIPQ